MANEADEGGAAFPTSHAPDGVYGGLTMRDYFAASALTGIITETATMNAIGQLKSNTETTFQVTSALAYAFADAMLKARQS